MRSSSHILNRSLETTRAELPHYRDLAVLELVGGTFPDHPALMKEYQPAQQHTHTEVKTIPLNRQTICSCQRSRRTEC